MVRLVSSRIAFEVEADTAARVWMDSHPSAEARVTSYKVTCCCGGGRICTVQVREQTRRDDVSRHAAVVLEGGTELRVDPRAAARLPPRFGLTVRGFGLSST